MSAHLTARASRRTLQPILLHASRQALQFRLMLLWLLGMAIPTILFALPVSYFLAGEMAHSTTAAALASSFELGAMIDLLDARAMSFSLIFAALVPPMLVMLIISPWLNALALGATRIPAPARFGSLISAANTAYWPMVRMGLFGLLPVMLALLVARIPSAAAARYDEHAVLESSVDHVLLAARLVTLLLVALAQCTVEVGRAVLVAHPRRHSVVRAWWAGLGFLWRHALYLFGSWMLFTAPLMFLVAVLMVVRTNLDQGSLIGLLLALLLAQACVLAWPGCVARDSFPWSIWWRALLLAAEFEVATELNCDLKSEFGKPASIVQIRHSVGT